jgi:hypothetical protein
VTLKNSPLVEVSGSVNALPAAPELSAKLNLKPGSVTVSAKPDKTGEVKHDILVSSTPAAFGTNLNIWPLQGGKFDFNITRSPCPPGSSVGFKYGSEDHTAKLILRPKFAAGCPHCPKSGFQAKSGHSVIFSMGLL